MNPEKCSELLSAALDGECSREELDRFLRELDRSPQMNLEWSRWWRVRDALAGAGVKPGQPCLCAGVMAALDAETAPADKVVPLLPRRRRAVWRPLAAMASAASVATVAFLLGYHTPASSPPPGAAARPQAPVLAAVSPAAARDPGQMLAGEPQARSAASHPSGWESLEEGDARQLNNYLIDYSSYRAGAGMADTLGYARFAAHTAEYNADH